MTSTVVFVGQSFPEKDLEKTAKFKAYISQDIQEEILRQIAEQLPKEDLQDWRVSMHVDVELRKYKNNK